MRFAAIDFLIAIAACGLPGCATPLLNSNTLDLASTVNDLAIRQIVYNLAKTKDNQFALPSQVWIGSGQVTAVASVTPNISGPFNPLLTATTQVTTALATTTSSTNTKTQASSTGTLSGQLQGQSSWSVTNLQESETLRRLRLLYQYGAGHIPAEDLLCDYPVPEKPQDTKSANSQPSGGRPQTPGSQRTGKTNDSNKKTEYIRGLARNTCENDSSLYESKNSFQAEWTLVGKDPDPAFITYPGCVLCAFHHKRFQQQLGRNSKIYLNTHSDTTEPFNPKNEYEYVVVNYELLPNTSYTDSNNTYGKGYIDWLRVIKDGTEPIAEDSRYIGSSNGYSVYVLHATQPLGKNVPSGDQHFSEFILAITEAELQSPQIQKAEPKSPPLVQTFPQPP
jgi:hypothetical protein